MKMFPWSPSSPPSLSVSPSSPVSGPPSFGLGLIYNWLDHWLLPEMAGVVYCIPAAYEENIPHRRQHENLCVLTVLFLWMGWEIIQVCSESRSVHKCNFIINAYIFGTWGEAKKIAESCADNFKTALIFYLSSITYIFFTPNHSLNHDNDVFINSSLLICMEP